MIDWMEIHTEYLFAYTESNGAYNRIVSHITSVCTRSIRLSEN